MTRNGNLIETYRIDFSRKPTQYFKINLLMSQPTTAGINIHFKDCYDILSFFKIEFSYNSFVRKSQYFSLDPGNL